MAYGQALCSLGQGKLAQAEAAFKQQGTRVTVPELRLVRAYIALLRGDKPDLGSLPVEDPRVSLLRAYASLRAGNAGAAAGFLQTAAAGRPPSHLLDQGAAMGFDPGVPILCTAVTSIADAAGGGALSPAGFLGKVRLRADRTKTPGASYVLFYVDSRLVGIVNTPPLNSCGTPPPWPMDSQSQDQGRGHLRMLRRDLPAGACCQLAPEASPLLAGAQFRRFSMPPGMPLRLRQPHVGRDELARQAAGEGRRLDAMLRYERILAFKPRYRDVRQRFGR